MVEMPMWRVKNSCSGRSHCRLAGVVCAQIVVGQTLSAPATEVASSMKKT
jgi:hypothetical protein